MIRSKWLRTPEACIQMYPQDESAMKHFHILTVLTARNLQPARTRGLVSYICMYKCRKISETTISIYQGIFSQPLRGSFGLLRCLPTWCHDECRQEQCVRGCIQVPLLNPRLFASWLATATDLGQKSHANVDSNYHFQCTHIPEIRSPQHNIRSSVPAKNEMLVHTIRYWNNLVQINTELNRMLAQN